MADTEAIEVWGGVECTVARIGDSFRDQVAETGHRDRPDDLDRIAALGIRTLRYPVLLETIAPERPGRRDWAWHDARLARIGELGMRPIAGLVHHGGGPAWTHLLDPAFPDHVARHAGQVARRYPWIDRYTPANEPLTTARFAALYGHWYPHERDLGAFLRAVVAQCRATLLAMREIRRVRPDATLVQTEDLGRTFATPPLADQAHHENERRWLSIDLLCGRVDRRHAAWDMLRDAGIAARTLDSFAGGEARPDIVGVNHYLTSERFLDHRIERYPAHLVGGNGRETYADVEAVRIDLPAGETGPAARLREAHARFGLPLAVTEIHHGSTRDEQLRWLREVTDAASAVRREGADVRAVTPWSLFGTVDWNSLLVRREGIYEPGAFDVRDREPRPTALAAAIRDLATTGRFDHPVLDRPGWWRRTARFYRAPRRSPVVRIRPPPARPILVVTPGGDGPEAGDPTVATLLDGLRRIADARALDLRPVQADDARDLAGAWAVLDLAAACAAAPDESLRRAAACAAAALPYAVMAGPPVFSAGGPWAESDPTSRTGPEGRAARREARCRAACPSALVIRTGPVFGPWDDRNLPFRVLRALSADLPPPDSGPGPVTPSYLPDLLHVTLDLLIDRASGVWHLVSGLTTGPALVDELARRAGLATRGAAGPPVPGPPPLASRRGILMPPLASALDRFVAEARPDWRAEPAFRGIAAE